MRRREAIKVSLGGVIGASQLWRVVAGIAAGASLTGCDDKDWEKIRKYCTVAVSSVKSIVDMLVAAGIISTKAGVPVQDVLGKIKAGFADVDAAVQQYVSAPDSQKAGLADKILIALQAVADNLQAFWNDLEIPAPELAQTISMLITLLVGTIGGYVAWVASETKRSTPASHALKMRAPVPAAIATKKRSASEFQDEFNAILKKNGYGRFAI